MSKERPPWERISYLSQQIAQLQVMHQVATSLLTTNVATSATLSYATELQAQLDALKRERAREIMDAGVIGGISLVV